MTASWSCTEPNVPLTTQKVMETWEWRMGVEVEGGGWKGTGVAWQWRVGEKAAEAAAEVEEERKRVERKKRGRREKPGALQRCCSLQTLTGSTSGGRGKGRRARGEFVLTCEESPPLVRDKDKAGWKTLGEDKAFVPLVVKVFFFSITYPSWLSGLHFTSSPTLHRTSWPSEDDGIHCNELLMLCCYLINSVFVFL